jgi:hypothetical protein
MLALLLWRELSGLGAATLAQMMLPATVDLQALAEIM